MLLSCEETGDTRRMVTPDVNVFITSDQPRLGDLQEFVAVRPVAKKTWQDLVTTIATLFPSLFVYLLSFCSSAFVAHMSWSTFNLLPQSRRALPLLRLFLLVVYKLELIMQTKIRMAAHYRPPSLLPPGLLGQLFDNAGLLPPHNAHPAGSRLPLGCRHLHNSWGPTQ